MKSQAQVEREIKSLRVNCNTYIGAFRFGNAEVRKQFANKEAIIAHFDGLIAKLKDEQAVIVEAATTCAKLADNKEHPDSAPIEPMTDVKDVSEYKTDFRNPERQMTIEMRNWQQATADAMFVDLYYHSMQAQLLLSGVGTGKTMMVGSMIQRLLDAHWPAKVKSFAPWPIIVVTKASVVEQFCSDLQYRFGIDIDNGEVLVTNYEQLRSKFGEQFIKESTVVKNGEPEIELSWKPFVHPALIVWDECHSLKNEGSTQARIAMACNKPELKGKMFQVFMSATPFTRVGDCKVFTCATRHEI
tara:strand:+ start:630 stop:1532 length:903 start_codon:yes stop_codon:yes gene_type:complete